MFLKAGAIAAIFMHTAFEQPVLIHANLTPPLCLPVFIALMTIQGGCTFLTRFLTFGPAEHISQPHE